MIKPFSSNLLFMDAEFSTINPAVGEIISIALIKPTGEELYLEIEHDPNTLDDWVKENVIPKFTGPLVSRAAAWEKLNEFIGPNHPYVVSYINHFDVVFFWKTFGMPKDRPTYDYWFPLDMATLLFFSGVDPRGYIHQPIIDQHNALTDTRLLKAGYEKLLADNA
ncbi:hypothetical protein JXA59_02465 [Patescibacteria group bacterium]|nr:hypothetical protein [Patescibacteria group bacterium]